jgi:uncharacterized membrane protein
MGAFAAFGDFGTGEGLGVDWPRHDLALFVFAALFLAAGIMTHCSPPRLYSERTKADVD